MQRPPTAGRRMSSLGATLRWLGQATHARERLERGIALSRSADETELSAHGLTALGDLLRDEGEIEDGLRCYEECLALRRQLGDRAGEDPNAPRKVRVIPIAPGGAPVVTASSTAIARPISSCGSWKASRIGFFNL